MATETTILLADDHPIVRQGLRQIIEAEPGLRVVGEANDGVEALAMIQELRPEVAVVDVGMPRMGGFELAREMKDRRIPTEIIFLTMYREESVFDQALSLGAKGYVIKDSAVAEIVTCIKAVVDGGHYASPSLTAYLFNRAGPAREAARQSPGIEALTPTERRVLSLIAEYKTSKEIAEELGIHYRTVENYRTNICAKLDLHGSHALVKFALRHQSELS
jgi:DNA-binding NarL/FixJ family response regulator